MSILRCAAVALFLMMSLISCENDPEEELYGTINLIGYGTSFGECLGYCVNYMKVYEDVANLTRTGWDGSGQLPAVQCSQPLELYQYIAIRDSIIPNDFFLLENTIGCPDCADGGAEWVEIRVDTSIHRVTFEYMNEPKELAYVVPLLRTLMANFNGCESQ
jgi:hypothetical protein